MSKKQREKPKRGLSPKQKKFCVEYIKNGANAAKAYELAGYSNKSPRNGAYQLLSNKQVQEYIQELAAGVDKQAVADADEVMRYLTQVMRGYHESHILVTVGTGKGKTEAVSVVKLPEERDQLEAAKTLAKIHGILTNKVDLTGGVAVQIWDDIPEGGELTGEPAKGADADA